jgi:hypothetical protein
VAPPRRSRAGIAAGIVALALFAGLTAYPALASDRLGEFLLLPGAFGTLVLIVALVVRVPSLVPWALVLLLGEYTAFLLLDGRDRFAPIVAGGLVLVAELAHWGIEPRSVGRARELTARRVLILLAIAGGSAALAAFLLGASELAAGGGLALEALGVASAVGTVALLAALARGRLTR